MKGLPKLSLVTRDDLSTATQPREVFELLAARDISTQEFKFYQQFVSEVLPRSAIIAFARTPRTWDLRPIVTSPSEDEPSIIRFVGPKLKESAQYNTLLKDTIERLETAGDLGNLVRAWGTYQDEFWYRRSFVEQTLAHQFSEPESFNVDNGLSLLKALVDELALWHRRGLVHGHICSTNIVWRNSSLSLIDPAIAAMQVQLGESKEESPYSSQSFAPEVWNAQGLVSTADLFGLGLVVKRVVLAVQRKYQLDKGRDRIEAALKPLMDLASAMLDADPRRRPALAELKSAVLEAGRSEALRRYSRQQQKTKIKARTSQVRRAVETVFEEEQTQPAARRLSDTATEVKPPPVQTPDPASAQTRQTGDIKPESQAPFVEPQAQPLPPQYVYGQAAPLPPQAVSPHLVGQMYIPQVIAPPQYYQPYSVVPTHAPQGVPPSTPASSTSPEGKGESKGFYFLLFGMFLALLAFYYYRTQDSGYVELREERQELQADWESKVPSRMRRVALEAIDLEQAERGAEAVILASAKSGDEIGPFVNVDFLRIAFANEWEAELSPQDRRTALAFALAPLLKTSLPEDLPALDSLHPGVLLAVIANLGAQANRKVFEKIPLSFFAQLPPPIGASFRVFVEQEPKLTLADSSVQSLARLLTLKINLDELRNFLGGKVDSRLKVLAEGLRSEPQRAEELLVLLLKHPNSVIQSAGISWAKDFDFYAWKGLSMNSKLDFMAGMLGQVQELATADIMKLLAHPAPEVRAFAMGQIINHLKLEHRAGVDVLNMLRANPGILNSEQTVTLVGMLLQPAKQDPLQINKWLESNPPQALLTTLLLGSSTADAATVVDATIAAYLQKQKWKPDLLQLRKLVSHPDSYTRLFAYSEIYLMDDRKIVEDFLKMAEKKETDERNLGQLQQMLLDLAH